MYVVVDVACHDSGTKRSSNFISEREKKQSTPDWLRLPSTHATQLCQQFIRE